MHLCVGLATVSLVDGHNVELEQLLDQRMVLAQISGPFDALPARYLANLDVLALGRAPRLLADHLENVASPEGMHLVQFDRTVCGGICISGEVFDAVVFVAI